MNATTNTLGSRRSSISRGAKPLVRASFRLRLWNATPRAARLALCYFWDFFRFWRHSGAVVGKRRTRSGASAHLTMEYHRLEKGLSFRNPRLNFGEVLVEKLCTELADYINNYGFDQTAASCWKALDAYHTFHCKHNAINSELLAKFNRIDLSPEQKASADQLNAVTYLSREDVLSSSKIDFGNFVFSRFSVRDFAEKQVDIGLIMEAARIAQRTPSVCNRQAWCLHVYQEPDIVKRVLRYQTGNRGFTRAIKTVLIVTVEEDHFFTPGERNQGFIDGGLYSMSLVYSLHSLGLASCCLNLAIELPGEIGLRRAGDIKPNEAFIMMIAVGHYPENLTVASSCRKNHLDVVKIHRAGAEKVA